jgi:tetratricopeptide (TPR) repeat protein
MSTDDKTTTSVEGEGIDEVCTSCGIAEVDDITLKFCDDCDLVKYCSDECQLNHGEQHEEECKKRKAELHGKHLFTQPDISHWGECPICFLPLPIDPSKSTMMTCCCKLICQGCCYANLKRENEQGLEHRCAFCREPARKSDEEIKKRIMERVKKDDPVAMTHMGKKLDKGGDYGKALEYYTKAVELGDIEAHYQLAFAYRVGRGVDKDEKRVVYHCEQAAIGGHTSTRGLLATYEKEIGRFDRAAKHLIINANLGCEISVKLMKDFFVQGIVSKEEYAAALRANQAAVNETKSAEREKADAFLREARRLDSQRN